MEKRLPWEDDLKSRSFAGTSYAVWMTNGLVLFNKKDFTFNGFTIMIDNKIITNKDKWGLLIEKKAILSYCQTKIRKLFTEYI